MCTSKKEDVKRCADQVIRDIGHVDILVNNAGIVTGKRFMDCPDDMIVKTMEVNTMAHFWVNLHYTESQMISKEILILVILNIYVHVSFYTGIKVCKGIFCHSDISSFTSFLPFILPPATFHYLFA